MRSMATWEIPIGESERKCNPPCVFSISAMVRWITPEPVIGPRLARARWANPPPASSHPNALIWPRTLNHCAPDPSEICGPDCNCNWAAALQELELHCESPRRKEETNEQ